MTKLEQLIPMPITIDMLGNKKFDMKFWSALVMVYGNNSEKGEMLINKKDIDEKRLAQTMGKSIKTISRKIKYLEDNEIIEIVNNKKGVFYRIKNLNDPVKYKWIERGRIEELLISGSSRTIKIYLLLCSKLSSGLRRTITFDEISSLIGLSIKGGGNRGRCSNEIDILVDLKLINITVIGIDGKEYDSKNDVDYIKGYMYELV